MEKFKHLTFVDNRGSYTPIDLKTLSVDWTQCSISINEKEFTFRGLHYQTNPSQKKYVKVIQGEIIDFALDLETGEVEYEHLTKDEAVYIPNTKAHGFLTLEPNTIISYLVEGGYNPESEHSIPWWKNVVISNIIKTYSQQNDVITSEKDYNGK
jgi:dTDP-4-dehydrorhamnose 3,5-epimerase-like enzyme